MLACVGGCGWVGISVGVGVGGCGCQCVSVLVWGCTAETGVCTYRENTCIEGLYPTHLGLTRQPR